MRRMARKPAALKTRPPRYPPQDTLNSFTQNGQCPLTRIVYYDNSQTGKNKPLYFSASRLRGLMEADRKGKSIPTYADAFSLLKPTLGRYRNYIDKAHVAVIGTQKPWAEAMLLNLGARRITTLEFQALGSDDNRVVAITPSQFAKNFIDATNNGKPVCVICNLFCVTGMSSLLLKILAYVGSM